MWTKYYRLHDIIYYIEQCCAFKKKSLDILSKDKLEVSRKLWRASLNNYTFYFSRTTFEQN